MIGNRFLGPPMGTSTKGGIGRRLSGGGLEVHKPVFEDRVARV